MEKKIHYNYFHLLVLRVGLKVLNMVVSLAGADVNSNTACKDSPLHLASFCCATQNVKNGFGVITSLLEAGTVQLTILTVCTQIHPFDNMQVLKSWYSHKLVDQKSVASFGLSYSVCKECFIHCISAGCNINSKNWLGNTPLTIAASSGKCSLVRHLMSLGMFAISATT